MKKVSFRIITVLAALFAASCSSPVSSDNSAAMLLPLLLSRGSGKAIMDFIFNKATGTITGYNGPGGVLTIPASIDGVAVIAIEKNAFRNKNISAVAIPDSVTSIGDGAFSDNQLTYVSLGPNVTLNGEPFGGGFEAAYDIDKYKDIYARPDSASTAWTYHPYNTVFTWNGSTAYTITGYTGAWTAVPIPSSIGGVTVTAIGDNAFQNKSLTAVAIPDSVTSIGSHAFAFNHLTSVVIPSSVTSIGLSAFVSNQLTAVAIPDSVTSIGDSAFYLNQLTSVTIPNSVTTIGNGAFYSNQLTSITIGAGVGFGTTPFDNGFEAAYAGTSQAAGTYTRPNTSSTVWTKQ